MHTCHTIADVRQAMAGLRTQGLRLGLVPTMGCLHEGHLSLIRLARERADAVMATIFVNPTQFGPGEDFAAYPRPLEADRAALEGAGTDLLFLPDRNEVYPPDYSVFVEETSLSDTLCGRTRPGHFRGVCTVVAKLLNIVQPDLAVFGEKDAQQLRIIRRLVRDLHLPVEIVAGPLVREADGLALSSRNRYLSPEDRRHALALSRALFAARDRFRAGERDAVRLIATARQILHTEPGVRTDYLELVDDETLRPLDRLDRPALLAVAAYVGPARLIDNVRLLR